TLAKQSNLRSVEFVPVDFVSQSQIADSFKNLFKACLPTEASKSFAQTSILAAAGLASVPVASQSTGQENDAAGNAPASAQSATTTSSTVTTMHMAIHDSRWLLQLQSLLQLSGAVVDLLDIQGVTVAVCIEDGTDAVTQSRSNFDPFFRMTYNFASQCTAQYAQRTVLTPLHTTWTTTKPSITMTLPPGHRSWL
ncbi:hypothetical protein P879_09237, partial [Paragonimus westermani]